MHTGGEGYKVQTVVRSMTHTSHKVVEERKEKQLNNEQAVPPPSQSYPRKRGLRVETYSLLIFFKIRLGSSHK